MAVHLAPAHAKRMAVMLARYSSGFAFRHHTAEQALAALDCVVLCASSQRLSRSIANKPVKVMHETQGALT